MKDKQILTKQQKNQIRIWNASQQPITKVGRFYTQPIGLEIGKHLEALVWDVGVIEHCIYGYLPVAWLQKHNPQVNWKTRQVKWRSLYCSENCLPKQVSSILVDKVQLIKEVQDCIDAFITTIEWRTEEGLEVLKVVPTQYHK